MSGAGQFGQGNEAGTVQEVAGVSEKFKKLVRTVHLYWEEKTGCSIRVREAQKVPAEYFYPLTDTLFRWTHGASNWLEYTPIFADRQFFAIPLD